MQRTVDHEQLEDDLEEYPVCHFKSRVQTLKVLSEQTKTFMFKYSYNKIDGFGIMTHDFI